MQTAQSSQDQSPPLFSKTPLPLTPKTLSLSLVQQQELFKETSRFENAPLPCVYIFGGRIATSVFADADREGEAVEIIF